MQVRVGEIGSRKRRMETKSRTVADLLAEMKINPETVVVRQNSHIRTHDSLLGDGDDIEIIPVVSGG